MYSRRRFRRILRVWASLASLFVIGLPTVAGAAGSNYQGGSGGTNVPIATLRILIAVPLTTSSRNIVLKAPKKATTANPGRVTLTIHVPAHTFSKGATLIVAVPPAILPPLYELMGAATFSAALSATALRVGTDSPLVVPAALPVVHIDSFYVGVYFGKKEQSAKYRHALTATLTSPTISRRDTLYQTLRLRWVASSGDAISAGKATFSLRNNGAFELVRVVHILRTVTFAANGGVGVISPLRVAQGSSISLPNSGVTRVGYQLAGWSVNGRAPALKSPYVVAKNVALKAIWLRHRVILDEVRFSAGSGVGHVAALKVANGTEINLPDGTGLTRAGYRFLGWSTNGTTPVMSSPYLVTRSIVLRAVWAKNSAITYQVTFLINGGHGMAESAVGTPGTKVALPTGAGLTWPGHTFVGWSLTGAGAPLVGPLTIHSNLVLKAIWR